MNQNAEQIARDKIDKQLQAVQDLNRINLNAGIGVAVREYPLIKAPADYTLLVDGTPVGVIEAKRIETGVKLTVVEEHSAKYAHNVVSEYTH